MGEAIMTFSGSSSSSVKQTPPKYKTFTGEFLNLVELEPDPLQLNGPVSYPVDATPVETNNNTVAPTGYYASGGGTDSDHPYIWTYPTLDCGKQPLTVTDGCGVSVTKMIKRAGSWKIREAWSPGIVASHNWTYPAAGQFDAEALTFSQGSMIRSAAYVYGDYWWDTRTVPYQWRPVTGKTLYSGCQPQTGLAVASLNRDLTFPALYDESGNIVSPHASWSHPSVWSDPYLWRTPPGVAVPDETTEMVLDAYGCGQIGHTHQYWWVSSYAIFDWHCTDSTLTGTIVDGDFTYYTYSDD